MNEDRNEPRLFGFSLDTIWKIAALLIGLGGMYEKFQAQFEAIQMRTY